MLTKIRNKNSILKAVTGTKERKKECIGKSRERRDKREN